ncbi:unnamed protein product, partial [Heterosigma akashiwo]
EGRRDEARAVPEGLGRGERAFHPAKNGSSTTSSGFQLPQENCKKDTAEQTIKAFRKTGQQSHVVHQDEEDIISSLPQSKGYNGDSSPSSTTNNNERIW